jgi:hypothetical protein
MEGDDLNDEYLTRSDIARILKISAKQAGRLMHRMPTLRVGRTHRRVARRDFDAWRSREREVSTEVQRLTPRQAAIRRAGRFLGAVSDGRSGSVFQAAEALRLRTRLRDKTPEQTPEVMSPSGDKPLI